MKSWKKTHPVAWLVLGGIVVGLIAFSVSSKNEPKEASEPQTTLLASTATTAKSNPAPAGAVDSAPTDGSASASGNPDKDSDEAWVAQFEASHPSDRCRAIAAAGEAAATMRDNGVSKAQALRLIRKTANGSHAYDMWVNNVYTDEDEKGASPKKIGSAYGMVCAAFRD